MRHSIHPYFQLLLRKCPRETFDAASALSEVKLHETIGLVASHPLFFFPFDQTQADWEAHQHRMVYCQCACSDYASWFAQL